MLASLFSLALYLSFKSEKEVKAVSKESEIQKIDYKENKETEPKKKIKFDIKGAVKKPGVYELDENKRVIDAIKISGGLTKEADTSLINLSKTVTDEMVIIIYTKNEIKNNNTVVKYVEKECVCPDVINDACLKAQEKKSVEEKKDSTSKISLNKASKEELQTLPGIGESKADAIIKYREENGEFKSTDEILKVNGIGESTYEKFKDLITI